jgi:hypothetical protein
MGTPRRAGPPYGLPHKPPRRGPFWTPIGGPFCVPIDNLGFSELTIAALLGHSARGVTQRYIHIDEALRMTADRVAAEMADILDGRATPSRHRLRRADVAERVPEQAGS